ncbi:hypothetical protein AB0230_12325 [Microbacterium sp. NPDC089190]|uniref:hypothetical protein n=1 Tax=Microbacterium sp. NPDC089190 TaxID=3155063 RepID=UPI00344C1022
MNVIARVHENGTARETLAVAEWLTNNSDAVAEVRPEWADPERTTACLDFDEEAESVWFVRQFDVIEVIQRADVKRGVLTLTGHPHVRAVSLPDMEETRMPDVAELGKDMIRAAQYVSASEGQDGDISMLRLSDVFRLRKLRRLASVDDRLRGLDD